MSYSPAFKATMIKKMTGPAALTANALSREVGVSQASLSRWKRDASRVLDMSTKKPEPPAPKPAKRAQDWTPEEKMQALLETGGMDDAGLGVYLRRTGLHMDQLTAWRTEAITALGGGPNKGKRTPDQRRIRVLERDLRRKDRALAETTALLVLKKKFETLFEDEDGDTTRESDE